MDHGTQQIARPGPGDSRDVAACPYEIPNYDMLALIGEGGFGSVWLARERVTGVRRAVKVLPKSNAVRTDRDIQGVRGYQRSAHNHPHLVQLLTVGETDHSFYYVMEAADNAASNESGAYEALTLRKHLDQTGRMTGPAALQWAAAITSAIAQLHKQGLAHFDLKPENILIIEGQPKLADVGLVETLGKPGRRSGTPAYMTPEGEPDDLYALGKILYEMITGRPAREFPRLPREIIQDRRRATAAAIQIANALCHHNEANRLRDVVRLLADLQSSILGARGLREKWRQLRPAAQFTLLSLAGVVVVLAVGAWMARPTRAIPGPIDRIDASLAIEAWTPVLHPKTRAFDADSGVPLQLPAIRLAGRPVMTMAPIVQPLPRPIHHFSLEVRFTALRSWGHLAIGLAGQEDGSDGVRMQFRGQPDGEGLDCMADALGVSPERDDNPIIGHPQPGVEYLARLTDCGETLRFELWPLARDSRIPLIQTIRYGHRDFVAQYVIIDYSAEHFGDHADIHSINVHELSGPLVEGAIPDPAALSSVPTRPVVSPLLNRYPRPDEDGLAGPWHPYRSEFWTPIGNWSWWYQRDRTSPRDLVRAVPFSSEKRRVIENAHVAGVRSSADALAGSQLLRFDGAAFSDARMSCHVTVPPPASENGTNDDQPSAPFLSHDASVGLVLRIQDEPPVGGGWGGGYYGYVIVHPTQSPSATGRIMRVESLAMSSEEPFAVVPQTYKVLAEKPVLGHAIPSGALHSDGFDLTFEARGGQMTLLVNGHTVCSAVDEAFKYGRIALYTCRLPATFERLTLDALPHHVGAMP